LLALLVVNGCVIADDIIKALCAAVERALAKSGEMQLFGTADRSFTLGHHLSTCRQRDGGRVQPKHRVLGRQGQRGHVRRAVWRLRQAKGQESQKKYLAKKQHCNSSPRGRRNAHCSSRRGTAWPAAGASTATAARLLPATL
jgi:hypothetical protein